MLSRLGTKGLLKGLLQKRFRALGLFLASYELWRRIRISEGEYPRSVVRPSSSPAPQVVNYKGEACFLLFYNRKKNKRGQL